ncbi:MAG TPA: hypothetical protein VJJ22_05245 [Candidatus Paceibacterota bacterium]
MDNNAVLPLMVGVALHHMKMRAPHKDGRVAWADEPHAPVLIEDYKPQRGFVYKVFIQNEEVWLEKLSEHAGRKWYIRDMCVYKPDGQLTLRDFAPHPGYYEQINGSDHDICSDCGLDAGPLQPGHRSGYHCRRSVASGDESRRGNPASTEKVFPLNAGKGQQMGKIVFFLGNNLVRPDGTGILAEARELGLCDDREIIVVTMPNDRLTPPEGVEVVTADKFVANPQTDYLVVGNGGMSAQLVVQYILVNMAAHEEYEGTVEIINLQREGAVRLWPLA